MLLALQPAIIVLVLQLTEFSWPDTTTFLEIVLN